MNFRHLFFCCLIVVCNSIGKEHVVDVTVFNQQVERFVKYSFIDTVKSKILLDSIWESAFASNDQKLISRAMYCKALSNEVSSNFDSALHYYKTSLTIKSKLKDTLGLAELNMSLARFYSNFGQIESQEKYLIEARKFILSSNTHSLIKWYTDMGYLQSQKEDLLGTKNYFKLALDLAKTTHSNQLSIARENYGSILNQMEQIDSASYYYRESLKDYERNKDTVNLATTYYNMALIYWYTPYSDSVRVYLEKAYRFSKTTHKQEAIETYLMGLSDYWEDEGDFKQSRKYLMELDSFKSKNFKESLAQKISDIEKSFLVKSQKEENATLKAQLQVKNIVRNASIVTAILFIIILLYQIKNSKQKRLLIEKEKSIKEQEIDRLLKEVELVSVTALIEGGEQERQRISRDLHDRLGSMLSIAKLHLSAINSNSDNSEVYSKAMQLIDESVAEVRKIAHDLNSTYLVSNGLSASLQELKRSIDASGKTKLNVFETSNNKRFGSEFEIAIFRIIQEAISNCLKHAEANKIDIHLTSNEQSFTLIIEDNGKGFNANKAHLGIGLMNIKQRVSALNGVLSIDSKLGKGTTLIVELDELELRNEN